MWCFIVCVLLIIIAILIYHLRVQKNKYLQNLLDSRNELKENFDKCSFYLNENIVLKKLIAKYEEEKFSNVYTFNTLSGVIKKEPIYEGRKALIGDYLSISYTNTEKVLRSLGFSVDIAHSSEDVVKKIKYGEHYDIIFSNNIYQDGTGSECLKKLRELNDFNIPIVIHTVTKDKRDFFINTIGFDDYIVKPVTQQNVKPILKKLLK